MIRLFTYGTLMRGFGNHQRYLARSVFVGSATTEPVFKMFDMGGYPAIVEGGSTAIVGELFDVCVETIACCDVLEGHPRFYERKKVRLSDGLEVVAYVLPAERLAPYRDGHYAFEIGDVESGSWAQHMETRRR